MVRAISGKIYTTFQQTHQKRRHLRYQTSMERFFFSQCQAHHQQLVDLHRSVRVGDQ